MLISVSAGSAPCLGLLYHPPASRREPQRARSTTGSRTSARCPHVPSPPSHGTSQRRGSSARRLCQRCLLSWLAQQRGAVALWGARCPGWHWQCPGDTPRCPAAHSTHRQRLRAGERAGTRQPPAPGSGDKGPCCRARGWPGGGGGGRGRRPPLPAPAAAPLTEPSTCQLISRQVLLMDLLLFLVSRAINLCHLTAASC